MKDLSIHIFNNWNTIGDRNKNASGIKRAINSPYFNPTSLLLNFFYKFRDTKVAITAHECLGSSARGRK